MDAIVPGSTSGTSNPDTATFDYSLTSDRVVTVDSNRNIRNLIFGNDSSYRYVLSGGSLLLSNGGSITTTSLNGDHTDTINSSIVLQGDGGTYTFNASADSPASLLAIAGAVTGVSTGANTTTLVLNGTNSGANLISGTIGNGSSGGKMAVTKRGTGTWALSGTNTFTGTLTVEEGILQVATVNNSSSSGVFGNNATAVVLGKTGGAIGTIEYTGSTASTDKKFTMATGGGGAFQVDTYGSVLTLTGLIDGAGSLTKTGPGTLNPTGTNTFTGQFTVEDGTLRIASITNSGTSGPLGAGTGSVILGRSGGYTGVLQYTGGSASSTKKFTMANDGAGTFQIDTSGVSLSLSGVIDGSGMLNKTGAGILTLSGVNSYSGGTTITDGTLALSGTGTLGSSGGSLTINGATAILSMGSTNQSVGAVYIWNSGQITGTGTLTGTSFDVESGTFGVKLAGASAYLTKNNTGTVTLTGANTYGGGTTIFNGTLAVSGSGTLGATTGSVTVDGSSSILSIGTVAQTLSTVYLWNGGTIISSGGALIATSTFSLESGSISAKLEGTGALAKESAGTVTLTGTNSYSGNTNINGGTLKTAKPISLPGLTTLGKINVAGGATLAINVGAAGSGYFTTTDIANLQTNAVFQPGAILGIDTTNAGGTFTYSSDMTGSVGLTKLGSGILVLSGAANNYTGGTRVYAGTLSLVSPGTLGSTSGDLTVDGSGAILSLGTTNQTVGAVRVLNSGQITRTVPAPDTGTTGILTATSFYMEAGTVSAKLAGAGATFTKSGDGTVSLSGVNSFGGGTTVTGGALSLAVTGALGASTAPVSVEGGTLALGATNQTAGTVTLKNGGQITSSTGTLTGSAFNFQNGTVSAKLAGSGNLTKTEVGSTVTLTGSNSYTGFTYVNEGTLQAKTLASLPGLSTPGKISVASGATLALNVGGSGEFTTTDINSLLTNASFAAGSLLGLDTTGTFAITGNITGSIGLTKLGAGTLTLSGTGNTYTGGTRIYAGTMVVSSNNALGTGGALLIDATSTGTAVLSMGATNQAVGAVQLMAGAQITGTGTLTGTSFAVENGTIGVKLAGSGAVLSKTTWGTVTLSGANTFDGGVQLSEGVIVLNNSGALGSAGTITMLGGTLQFTASNQVDYSSRFSTVANQAFNFDTNGQSIILASNISSVDGSLSKTGLGTLTLSGTNTYSGSTTLSGGTLQVTKAAALPGQTTYGAITIGYDSTLALYAGGTGEFGPTDFTNLFDNATFYDYSTLSINTTNGDAVCPGNMSQSFKLVKLGGNVLTLTGFNSYSGGTVIGVANQGNAGTLRLSGAGTLGTAGPVTIYGGTLDLNGTTQTISSLTLGEGAAASTAAITVGSGELRLGGNVEFKATNNPQGATISGTSGGRIGLYGDRTFTVGDTTASFYDLTISADIRNGDAGARGLIKAGPGTLLLSGSNTYTGSTTVNAGMLWVTKVGALPGQSTVGLISVASGATLGINVGGSGEFTGSDLTNLLAKATFSSSSVLGIDTSNAGGTFTTSNLTGNVSINKVGSGTLVISGSGNTYTGTTTITAGGFQVNGTLGTGGLISVPAGSTMNIAAGGSVGRDVTISGGALDLAGTMTASSTLTLAAGTINTVGNAATVGNVVLPLKGVTPVFAAPTDQELTVSTKLTQALSDGYISITAGTTPFKVTGSNLVNNIDKLNLRGGSTTISRLIASYSAGLEVRAWSGSAGNNIGALEGTAFDTQAPTDSTTGGTIGWCTGVIHLEGSDHEHFADGTNGSGVVSGGMPTGYQNNYTVEYRGKLYIGTAGTYTFSTTSDDGSALWIDPSSSNPAYSEAIVQNGGSHGMQLAASGPVSLSVGYHDILVRMFEGGGGNGLYVQWDPAGGSSFVDIPGGNFYHGSQSAAAANLSGTEVLVTATSTLNLGYSSGKATLGTLTLNTGTLTLQSASSVSFDNINANETVNISGTVPVALRTGNVTVADTKTLTISPAVVNDSPVGPLNKLGNGTLVLAGTNTYTGATNVSAGTFSLNGSLSGTAITVSSGATLTESNLGSIGGASSLTVSGTATLNGVNTYTGTTTVNSGTLTLGGANTCSGATILNGGSLVVTNSSALQRSNVTFNGGTIDTGVLSSVPLGGVTANVDTSLNTALATITGYPTWAAAAGKTLSITGSVTRTQGAAINFGSTGTISGSGLATLLGTNTVNSWASFGGTDWAVYNGTTIAAFTSYTPPTGTSSAATLTHSPGANYKIDDSTTGIVTLASTGTVDINTLLLNGSTARTVDIRNGATQGILRLGATGGFLIAGGNHTIGVGGAVGTITAGGPVADTAGEMGFIVTSTTATINSVIADNGTGKVSLTKSGAGTLTLAGNNTYSGDTTINTGLLSPSGGNGIPNGSGKGNVLVSVAGTLALVNTTETINGLNGNGVVSGEGASSGRLTVGDGNASGVFAGVMKNGATGAFHLTKIGTGTQTLTGTSTYTGTTTVSGGILALDFSVSNPTNILSSSTGLALNGGTLSVKGKASGTTAQTVNGLTLTTGASAIGLDGNGGGGTLLTLGAISRSAGSYVTFTLPSGTQSSTNGITTTTGVVNSILGAYATVGSDWAAKSVNNIVPFSGYTNVAALGSSIVSNAASNVRINSAGSGANLALATTTTSINTLLQASTTAATVDTAGKVLQTAGIMLGSGQAALTIGVNPGDGRVNSAASGGELVLINNSSSSLFTVNSIIQNNGSVASSLAKLGTGTVVLASANIFTGTTYLCGGTLTLGNANSLQGSVVNFNGGTLDTGVLANANLAGITANTDVTINSATATISGNPVWTAAAGRTLTAGGSVTRMPGAAINFGSTGTITGAGLGSLLGTNTVNAWASFGGTDWAVYDGSKMSAYTGYTSPTGSSSAPTLTTSSGANYRIDNNTTGNATLAATGTIDINTLLLNGSTGRTVDLRNVSTQGILRLNATGGILLAGGTHTIGVSGTAGTLTAGGPVADTAGQINFIVSASTATLNSVVADNGAGKVSLNKSGSGTLIMAGVNTYGGDTIINSGVLQTNGNTIPNGVGKGNVSIGLFGSLNLNQTTETINGLNGNGTVNSSAAGASTLTIGDGGASGSFAGSIKNTTGTLSVVKTGSGTQTLSEASTYSGTTTVNAGTLALDFSVTSPTVVLPSSSALTVGGGGALTVKGKSSGTTSQTFAGLTVNSGGGQVLADANGGTSTTITLGALTTTAAGGTLLVGASGSSTTGLTITTSTNKNAQGTYGSRVVFFNGTAATGYDWATTVSTASPYTLSGLSSYTTMVAAATSDSLNDVTGSLTLSGAHTHNSLKLTSGATLDTAANLLTLTSGGLLSTGTSASTISGTAGAARLTAGNGSGAYELVVHQYNTGGLTIGAVIGNNSTNATAFTKAGTGTLTLTGANTYTGTTLIARGRLTVASAGTINTSSGVSIAAGELNYNSSTALSQPITFISSGGILSGTGTITPTVTVAADNTLAPGNSIGTIVLNGGLTLAGIMSAELGTPAATPASGVSDRATVTGALTLTGGTLSIVDNAGANGQGSAGAGAYRLITFTGTRTGTFAMVSNPLSATLHESVTYNGTSNGSVDLSLFRVASSNTISSPSGFGNVRVGGTFGTATLTVQNTATADGFSEGLNVSAGGTTGIASASGSITNLAAGATNSSSIIVGLGGSANTGTAGLKSGTVTINLASNGSGTSGYGATALTPQTVNVSGGVYDYANAKYAGTTLAFGNVHVGASVASQSVAFGNQTVTSASYQDLLNVSATTGNAKVTATGFTGLAASTNGSTTNNLTFSVNTTTVGSLASTPSLTLVSNANGVVGLSNGTATVVGTPGAITTTGVVYSGLMTWNGATGGAWGTGSNWNDSLDAGIHVAPGLDAGFTGTDTATFGNVAGAVTVNLNGVAPSLNAVTFNTTGSYTVAQGSGSTGISMAGTTPAITVAGAHSISAPLQLVNNTSVSVTNSGDSLTISGAIAGSGKGLTKSGAGTLTLAGTNTYTGATIVSLGTLAIGSGGSLANTTLTVQPSATLSGAGIIGGSTTIQGIEAPGGSGIGIQTFSNSLSLAATSHLQWQLVDNITTGRGTNFDGLNITGGTFAIDSGATIDLTFGGAVDFNLSFWDSNQSWLIADLGNGVTGNGGTGLFNLGTITGGGYNSSFGTFAISRVADGDGKNDVLLNWTAASTGGGVFESWIGGKGLSGANAAADADPDHDGLPNALEFVLGGEPNPANPNWNSRNLLPTATRNVGGDLVYSFKRKDLSETGSTLVFQWSTNLTFTGANDVPVGATSSSTNGVVANVTENVPDADTDSIVITVPAAKAVDGKIFGRLAVTTTSSADPFTTWTTSMGLSGGDAAADADPDHDGLPNSLEMVVGGQPNPANPGYNSRSLLPVTTRASNGDLICTFHRKDISEGVVSVVFQWSTNLLFTGANDVPVGATNSSTNGVTVNVTENSPDADTDLIVITVPASKAVDGKLFGRLLTSVP